LREVATISLTIDFICAPLIFASARSESGSATGV
jgi:hypothetical protein